MGFPPLVVKGVETPGAWMVRTASEGFIAVAHLRIACQRHGVNEVEGVRWQTEAFTNPGRNAVPASLARQPGLDVFGHQIGQESDVADHILALLRSVMIDDALDNPRRQLPVLRLSLIHI